MNIRQQIFRQLLAGALVTWLSGAVSGTALADDGDAAPARTMVVRFGDLNLSSEEGVQKLYGRIRQAATTVCSETGPSSARPYSLEFQQCKEQAINTAVGKINNKVLTAMHQQKTSRRYG